MKNSVWASALLLSLSSGIAFGDASRAATKNASSIWQANSSSLPGKAAIMSWADPEVKPWAAVLAIHGLGFHKETYDAFARRLAKVGVETYALDVRGFGFWKEAKSDGKPPKVDFEQTFSDVKEALEMIRKNQPGQPVYLMGESMGGAIALQSAARYPQLVNGVISSVPASNSRYTVPMVLKTAAVGLLRGPNAQVDIEKSVVKQATAKPELQEKILDDPRTRRRLTVRDLLAFRNLMMKNKAAARKLDKTPSLVLQGYRDKLVHPGGTIKIFNAIKNSDKNLVIVGQNEHLVLEEGQFTDYTFDAVANWIDKHSANSTLQMASQDSKKSGKVTSSRGGNKIEAETEGKHAY